ncbi:MAG: efflux RND transporter periplasmic adaptor subunit [Burkholderiaceae bacterium]|nr:efflux RND transporter periplasmic adaptor subunit [Burkholderiaceae bacterium]
MVAARNTDVGALVSVGGAPGSELFVVSDLRRLRVYVNLPQRQVAQIRPGGAARLMVPERAGRSYPATLQSLSQAINAASGSMLVQLAVDNRAGELLAGSFATMRFDLPAMAEAVTVPPGALILGKGGPRLAVLDQASRVQLKPVTITRDFGNAVQLDGVQRGERVIANPPDGIAAGDTVRVAEAGKITR